MSEVLAQGPGLSAFLTLAAVLFCIGLYGVLTRKNIIAVLLSVELMANAVNINMIAFARFSEDLLGQAFALFSIALTVAEVVVGLAIVILIYRTHKDIDADTPSELHG
jgi:NADH-quinone oxidoreductase subunit K